MEVRFHLMIYRLVKGPQNTPRFTQNVTKGQIPSLFYRLVYGPSKTPQKFEPDSNCSKPVQINWCSWRVMIEHYRYISQEIVDNDFETNSNTELRLFVPTLIEPNHAYPCPSWLSRVTLIRARNLSSQEQLPDPLWTDVCKLEVWARLSVTHQKLGPRLSVTFW